MASYILLTQWTDQGIKNAKGAPKRQQDAREMAKKFGVEWKSVYMTMGAYDFVMTIEAPDDAAVAKFVLSLCALGNVRTTTLKAFTETEYRAIIDAAS
ncbi:MAG TPA: GYD domain-containing protein [Geminicoccaceae bacterium]|nr:GYD domain-containing protein [Geminicoccaceae bacterium]